MKMNHLNELQDIGVYLKVNKMLLGNAGNISVREKDGFLISASGSFLDKLTEKTVCFCDMEGNYEGKKPSKEFLLHKCIYEKRKDINCVIHCSPFYATMIGCMDINFQKNLFVESMYYLKSLKEIAFANPGSKELVDLIDEVCLKTNVILMKHHGVLVYGETIEKVKMILTVLEVCAKMNILGKDGLVEVEEKSVSCFLNESGYKK